MENKIKLDIQKIQNFLNEFNKRFANALEINEDATEGITLFINYNKSTVFYKELAVLNEEFRDENPMITDSDILYDVFNKDYYI